MTKSPEQNRWTFVGHAMRVYWFVAVLLLILCGLTTIGRAQLVVSNRFVTAKVYGNNGLISVSTTLGGYYGQKPIILTYPSKSYLTVMINGYLYTNNEPSNFNFSSLPNFGGYLTDGESYIQGDTIRTLWDISAGRIEQDVYPVAFEFSGQIVMKWKFVNKFSNPITVQSQFLLDTKIHKNDQAKVLTRFGYRRSWSGYVDNNDNYKPIPPFYQAFEQDPDTSNAFNPGLVSQGTFISPALALIKPLSVQIGDWYDNLSGTPWGWQLPLPTGDYHDSGVLIIFPVTGASPLDSVEMGKTAYGTGQFESCTGDLYALIYRPRTIKANAAGTDYLPNPFPVEMYLFNTNRYTQADYTFVTLTVGPHLHILDSNLKPIAGNSIRLPATPQTVGLGSVSTMLWNILADHTCAGDTSYLSFYTKSTLGDPSFNELCKVPLILPCLDRDTLPPIAEPVVIDGFLKTVGFHDDRITDKGIQSIQTFGFNTNYFRVTVDPFTPCTKSHTPVVVHITQLDSTVAGCVTIKVTDCANNVTQEDICFPKYPLHPDTVKPRIILISSTGSFDSSFCNMKTDSLLAVDDTTYDKGILSIRIADSSKLRNFDLVVPNITPGVGRQGFALRVRDSLVDGCITVRVTDRAGNFTDTTFCFCTIADSHPPEVQILQTSPYTWAVYVQDIHAYDRRIDTIDVHNRQNVVLKKNGVLFEPTRSLTKFRSNFDFTVEVADTSKFSSFCIKAKDLADSSSLAPTAHWWSRDTCLSRDTVQDTWAPNILIDPPPFLSPTKLNITVNDIHYFNGHLIGWDRGIDSIWFTNVHGMSVPQTIYMGCRTRDTTFQITVTNFFSLDSIATVCVHAIDCAGNQTDTCWYYPVKQDNVPPQISSIDESRTRLDLVITDSTLYDRGLRHTILDSSVNFDNYERWDNGSPVDTATLKVTAPGQSSTGVIRSIDLYGSHAITTQEQNAHSASVHVAIWVQNIRFKASTIAAQSSDIRIPVLLSLTDTFPVVRKNITKYSFSFDLVGDAGFNYVTFDTKGTQSLHFDVTDNVVGNRITITGTSKDGRPILDMDSPLVFIVIHAQKDETTRKIILTPATINGNSVVYNDDLPYTVSGQNATASLPAPYGTMGSGVILAVGSCSPSLKTGNGTVTVPDLVQNSPNPFTGSTKLIFALPKDGLATLIVYDALGRECARLVNGEVSAGSYEVTFNPKGLPGGIYYARLETNNQILTRRMSFIK
jgi:hypothetical protein